MYADNLVLCSESEGDLSDDNMLFEVSKRRCLRVNADKSKMMILGGTEDRCVRLL